MDQYRKFWEESYDRLDAYLQTLQADAAKPTKEKGAEKAEKEGKKKHGKRK